MNLMTTMTTEPSHLGIWECLTKHKLLLAILFGVAVFLLAAGNPLPFADDSHQALERTCFQTGKPWTPQGNPGSDDAIVYGIDTHLPARIESWRTHGYRIYFMTGVAWGEHQDYLYGRFDGISPEDEAQTDRDGHKISQGGDVCYYCPGTNCGKFLCVGVQRAPDSLG